MERDLPNPEASYVHAEKGEVNEYPYVGPTPLGTRGLQMRVFTSKDAPAEEGLGLKVEQGLGNPTPPPPPHPTPSSMECAGEREFD